MDLKVAVLADAANASVEGKLNITGIFDTVFPIGTSTNVPPGEAPRLLLPPLNLALLFYVHLSEAGEHALLVRLVDADGGVHLEVGGDFEPPPPDEGSVTSQVQFIFPMFNLNLPSLGDYVFDIYVDRRLQTSVPLFVRPRPGAAA